MREEEVGGVVAMQVADLAAADLEGELAAAAGAGVDALPGGHLLGDPLARGLGSLRCGGRAHLVLLGIGISGVTSNYKLK